jgi:hypothetical protein
MNLNSNPLYCHICNRESIQAPPGIHWIDLFIRHNCKSCNQELMVCSSCSTTNLRECKSCKRETKIDIILK